MSAWDVELALELNSFSKSQNTRGEKSIVVLESWETQPTFMAVAVPVELGRAKLGCQVCGNGIFLSENSHCTFLCRAWEHAMWGSGFGTSEKDEQLENNTRCMFTCDVFHCYKSSLVLSWWCSVTGKMVSTAAVHSCEMPILFIAYSVRGLLMGSTGILKALPHLPQFSCTIPWESYSCVI